METGKFAESGEGAPLSRPGDPSPSSADLHTGYF
uniref:Uncharacterized protein n=1 Tax=Siphoviridae sp. ctM3g2 TaxID=2826255 RepID=A0A8S5LUI2_9CAUD|nr:MAG TPA: hypothetical protein [Siphoviridae sp. ctM3g2]